MREKRMLRLRLLLFGGMGVLAALGLVGCFLLDLSSITQTSLVVSQFVGQVGERVEVKVSAVAMPGGGLAGLAVGAGSSGGLCYDPAQFQVTGVVGLNGFVVLRWCTFDAGDGRRCARFVAVNPTGGVTTGDAVKIVGVRRGGGDPLFAASSLDLSDADNRLITDYRVTIGGASPYFVRGGN